MFKGTHICDRCGKDYGGKGSRNLDVVYPNPPHQFFLAQPGKWELCIECSNALKSWLEVTP